MDEVQSERLPVGRFLGELVFPAVMISPIVSIAALKRKENLLNLLLKQNRTLNSTGHLVGFHDPALSDQSSCYTSGKSISLPQLLEVMGTSRYHLTIPINYI